MAYSDADIEELINRQKITDVLLRYCRALDRCDLEMMRTVYWEDGIDEHGVFSGNAAEFAEYIIREVRNWFEVATHAISNIFIELDGNIACTESYLFSYCRVRGDKRQVEEVFGTRYMQQFDWSNVEGIPHQFYMGGRYIDRLEKRRDEWRIAKRVVVMDWNDNHISGEILDQGIYGHLRPLGARDKSDAVYSNTPR